MALTVNSNIASLNAQRNLSGSTNALSTSLERLSSGSRINSAKDDAAGLQISNRLTSQINGLNVAVKNANDGISMAQTAEGALQESTNIMQRMRDLALQASNGSNSAEERKALNQEFTNLSGELTRIAKTTTFGGKNLLDGTLKGESFQVGSNAGETLSFSIGDMSAKGLSGQSTLAEFEAGAAAVADVEDDGTVTADGFDAAGKLITAAGDGVSIKLNGTIVSFEEGDTLDKVVDKINNASTGVTAAKNEDGDGIVLTSLQDFTVEDGDPAGLEVLGLDGWESDTDGVAESANHTIDSLDILTAGNAQLAIQALDDAIASVDSTRADLGAVQNRFESTISNLQNIAENASAARGRIMDTDYAAESANLAKNQIMQQAGTAMLAQANQLPQAVLSLLG
ncbi:flagellin [Halopseudomonas formosensis]|uniref:Flagellin n=1 Tax=Halopseudomonas formosensis TaxID=1002526 RepID=A0ABU5BX80_9GAMM|nr:flagellin [Halopseudomonas formosensis]MDX9687266.1 flagellin [Halopseudomonas formosensis]